MGERQQVRPGSGSCAYVEGEVSQRGGSAEEPDDICILEQLPISNVEEGRWVREEEPGSTEEVTAVAEVRSSEGLS